MIFQTCQDELARRAKTLQLLGGIAELRLSVENPAL
jgi:hypothetical protein